MVDELSNRALITPNIIYNMGRFLCKIGIELLCLNDPEYVRSEKFLLARKYARYGSTDELWPLFRYSSGSISDLTISVNGNCEEVICYEYSLLEFGQYTVVRLKVGTSSWLVCLNDQWPTPSIKEAFPQTDLQLIWYPKESFRNKSGQ